MSVTNYEAYAIAYNSGDFMTCGDIIYQYIVYSTDQTYPFPSEFRATFQDYVKELMVRGDPLPSKEKVN